MQRKNAKKKKMCKGGGKEQKKIMQKESSPIEQLNTPVILQLMR